MASGSVHDALADVAFRLESLKATLNDKEAGVCTEASQLAAIKRMARELESLLELQPGGRPPHGQPQQEPVCAAAQSGIATAGSLETAPVCQPGAAPQQQQQAAEVSAGRQETLPAAALSYPARLPVTPFDQRRPAAGPATAVKAPAPTPEGGLPATTPFAAEVLASLNFLAGGGGTAATPAAPTTAMTTAAAEADALAAEGDAVATLRSLEQLSSGGGASSQQQQYELQQQAAAGAGSSFFQQGAHVMPAAHSAAMAAAAAAAAGPALPVLRRNSGGVLAAAGGACAGSQPRPCNCKRSMCLKMYCECFASGGFCAPSCSCLTCSNTAQDMGAVQAAREVVLAKNPRAFEVKVTASEGHKRGCRCKRSKCLKKYCECFHAGARCNPDICQCDDCRNTDVDALTAPALGSGRLAWTDTSADVLAMFQQQLPVSAAGSGGSNSSGSGGEGAAAGYSMRGGGGGARRGKAARAQQLPAPVFAEHGMAAPFNFGLPPLPQAAFSGGSGPAAAMFGSFSAAAMFGPPMAAVAMPPAFDPAAAAAAFMLHPMAAAAAATFAAAATMQQQRVLEESMADAVSYPAATATMGVPAGAAAAVGTAAAGGLQLPAGAPLAGATAAAVTALPGGMLKMASALTSHLSDMAGPADSDMHDTATSPAPFMAMSKLAAVRRNLAGIAAPIHTLSGGGAAAGLLLGRPPLPNSRPRTAGPCGDSQLSLGSADENAGDSANTAGSQQRSKRPRRAASGGVLGAVAAEAADWGFDLVSPPLKRANSMPAVPCEGGKGRGGGKVSDRVALLKKALAGESAAVHHKHSVQGVCGGDGVCRPLLPPLPRLAAVEMDDGAPSPEDADAVSALFELSSSMC